MEIIESTHLESRDMRLSQEPLSIYKVGRTWAVKTPSKENV